VDGIYAFLFLLMMVMFPDFETVTHLKVLIHTQRLYKDNGTLVLQGRYTARHTESHSTLYTSLEFLLSPDITIASVGGRCL
jgi:hypothetical protein